MEEHLVVIEDYGFLTTKKPNTVLKTDKVLFKGSEQECNDIIHGVHKEKSKKIH